MKRALVMVLWLLVSHALAVVLYRRGTLPGTRVQLVESEAGLTSQLSAEGWEDMGCSSTHCMVIHVLFSFSLASSSMDARLITGSLGMVRPRHVTFIHVLFKKELTCDFSPSTRMLAAGRFINLGKKELTRDFTPSMGLFQCNNHCRHYKKAWDKIASSLLKPEGCPGGA